MTNKEKESLQPNCRIITDTGDLGAAYIDSLHDDRLIITAGQFIRTGEKERPIEAIKKDFGILSTGKLISSEPLTLQGGDIIITYEFEVSPVEYLCRNINQIAGFFRFFVPPTAEGEPTIEEAQQDIEYQCIRLAERLTDYTDAETAERIRPLTDERLKSGELSPEQFAEACKDITDIVLAAAENAIQQAAKELNELPTAPERRPLPDNFTVIIDKISKVVFENKITAAEAYGQLTFADIGIATDPAAPLIFSIDFSEVAKDPTVKTAITRLTAYDLRIYNAVSTLYKAGITEFTATQLYHLATGKAGSPPTDTIKKISDALKRLRQIQITIDNTIPHSSKSQAEATATKYPQIRYTGSLLPTILIDYNDRNQRVTYIKTLTTPPLLLNAEGKKQLFAVPANYLNGSTNNQITICDYILTEIYKKRKPTRGTVTFTITLSKLKEIAPGYKNKTGRLQALSTSYLQVLKSKGAITAFSETKTGYKITKKA